MQLQLRFFNKYKGLFESISGALSKTPASELVCRWKYSTSCRILVFRCINAVSSIATISDFFKYNKLNQSDMGDNGCVCSCIKRLNLTLIEGNHGK